MAMVLLFLLFENQTAEQKPVVMVSCKEKQKTNLQEVSNSIREKRTTLPPNVCTLQEAEELQSRMARTTLAEGWMTTRRGSIVQSNLASGLVVAGRQATDEPCDAVSTTSTFKFRLEPKSTCPCLLHAWRYAPVAVSLAYSYN